MAEEVSAVKNKRKFRGIKAESYLKDKFLHGKTATKSRMCSAGCGASSESCTRFLKLTRFFCVCTASLLQMVAPWMLCTVEVVAVLCIYCLGTTKSLVLHPLPEHHHYHFSYRHSLEDVVGISVARALLLSITYALGMHFMHRPYLYTSYLLAALCFPAIVVKTILYRYGQDAVPAACLFGLAGMFCWLHVFAARRSAEWVRRRALLGLTGYGCPWDEAPEDGWTALRRAPDIEEMTKCSDGPEWGEDVAPETLADADSKFVDIGGVRVHYKEALPPPTPNHGGGGGGDGSSSSSITGSCSPCSSGILLIHSFGGGVVSWRHLLEPLARHTGLRVVAYDRPAFGLTSRPVPTNEQDVPYANPYTMDSQANLVLDFCCQVGLQTVILAGHADGCLLALKANSLLQAERAACSGAYADNAPTFRPPSPRFSRDSAPLVGSEYPHPPALPLPVLAGGAQGVGTPAEGMAQQAQQLADHASAGRLSPSEHSSAVPSEGEQLYDAASQFGSAASASSLCPPFMSSCSSCSLSQSYATPGSASMASLPPAPYVPASAGATAMGPAQEEAVPSVISASAAADGSDAGLGAAASSSNSTATALWGSSTRHRKAQAACVWGGLTPPHSPSLHAWSPSDRQCRPLRIIGLALLHPDLSGSLGPSMTRLLARSKLGRSILRPLLRSEVGEVANPRAWHNSDKLTPEIVEMYKAPVEGWCEALIETTRLRSTSQKSDLSACMSDARPLPALVLTGLQDVIVPPARANQLAQGLPLSRVAVLADCGHLSHEEVPVTLLQHLQMFCCQVHA